MIDYSLKNVILIILKAFSNLPHSKIETLKEKLQDINNHRQESIQIPETPEIESDQESGEVQINGKEEKPKISPKRVNFEKKSLQERPRKLNRDFDRTDRESQSKTRPFRRDRGDKGDYKGQEKSFRSGYKKSKYH